MSTLPLSYNFAHRTVVSRTVIESDLDRLNFIQDLAGSADLAPTATATSSSDLTLSFAAAAVAKFLASTGLEAISYGYDKVRFLAPVRLGDTVTVSYQIADVNATRDESRAAIRAINQHGATVMVSVHILRFCA